MVALLSIYLVSNPVMCTRYHSYHAQKQHALTRADGRQFRQPITCVLAVAGGGIASKKWTKVTDY